MSNRNELSSPSSGSDAETRCDRTIEECPYCKFDLDLDFVGNDDSDILTPFSIPSFEDYSTGTRSKDKVNFKITIEENQVDKISVEIFVDRGSSTSGATTVTTTQILLTEELDASKRAVGEHEWSWNGFDSFGILDTKVLKHPGLTMKVTAELCGKSKEKSINFDNNHAEQDWVDVRVNRNTNQVDIELRMELDDGGDNGVGEIPPDAARNSALYKSLPANHPSKQPHSRVRSYGDLKRLVHDGIRKYWSRSLGSLRYNAITTSVESGSKHMDDINVEYNTNGSWMRSSNPGSVRGFYSLFGNFLPERAVYNVGWIEYSNNVWAYQQPSDADKEFSETAAHELGHEILSAYGGDSYSYGHRGSSTVITQETKSPSNGGFTYPSTGEIDLMKYYNGSRPHDFYNRVVASEMDVKSLIWLARVKFDD